MIIGDGDVATVLQDRDQKYRIYFASGVSNSQETRQSEYDREMDLLLIQDKNKRLIYFSSLCIFYSQSRYAQHKLYMEKLIKKNFKYYTIIRIGNIAWGKNIHTIINFFKNKIEKGEPIEIQNTHRYVVEKDEFLHWIDMIPEWNCEMNITGQYLTIKEIIEKYVNK